MNTDQTTLKNSSTSGQIFLGSPVSINYFWKNIIIEKRASKNWLEKIYKGSILNDFWSVLTSVVL